LDAGGTSFVFSAIRDGREVGGALSLPSLGDDLDACLDQIRRGFERVHEQTGGEARAISFAFPGPADYPRGIIGDLGNLPGFRGGVALGPMLERHFGLPVLIHNDADLFALGEARWGRLPEVNRALEASGSPFRHRTLLGLTLGTGFGAGIVADGRLLRGDNTSGGSIWLVRSKRFPECFAEEGVSLRAVKRAYAEAAGLADEVSPDPRRIADIARGMVPGDTAAAREAFRALGEAVGDALATALTLVDGLTVIGGGLSGSADLFMPALMAELKGTLAKRDGGRVPRLESTAFNLEDAEDEAAFRDSGRGPSKRVGICVTRLGTARATALGAWAMAVETLSPA
ncbi:MAG: ROK family protein, partial [Acidobacteriota bacterium]|nr:ROK family protein [Acidobacteriota bacterium]